MTAPFGAAAWISASLRLQFRYAPIPAFLRTSPAGTRTQRLWQMGCQPKIASNTLPSLGSGAGRRPLASRVAPMRITLLSVDQQARHENLRAFRHRWTRKPIVYTLHLLNIYKYRLICSKSRPR
jgi:hypothetical protein